MNAKKHYLFTYYVIALAMTLVSCEEKSNSWLSFDYLPVQMSKDANWSIIDKDGNEVVKEEYPADAEISLIQDDVYWVKTNGKCQLFSIDSPKKPITEEEYTSVTLFNAGFAFVSNPNQQIRIIDTKGKTVATLPKSVKKCWTFSDEGYAAFMDTNDKIGILDNNGTIAVPASYSDMIVEMNDGLTLARKNKDDKLWIVINMRGEKIGEVNTEKYHLLNNTIQEGKIIVRDESNEDGPTIVLDKAGKKLFEIRKARERYGSATYSGGYLTFMNADNKCGVADDKGEEVIRPKYDALMNLGNGEFAAKKSDKWGVINEKDETILEFDYEEGCLKMGSYYFIKDTSGWVMVSKDKKEITSCDAIGAGATSRSVEYVDIDGISNAIIKIIEEWEEPITAAECAKNYSLKPDDYHYSRGISLTSNIDNKVSCTLDINYDEYIVEEKTHEEQVNDGWFTYNRTVSDGWGWTNAMPTRISESFSLSDDTGIDVKLLYDSLCERLVKGRKRLSDDTFSKNVKLDSRIVESRIGCSLSGDKISIDISYHQ